MSNLSAEAFGLLSQVAQRLLATAVELAEQQEWRVYAIGGIIRDSFVGRAPGRDVDLVVEGNVAQLARLIAAATGGEVIAEHPPFGTASVRANGVTLDLAMARREHYATPAALPTVSPAPIEQDLARRDFSVNAIAWQLQVRDGAIQIAHELDPFGGRRDLRERCLRLLHAGSLRDDPTRMLRGVRLAGRLGFVRAQSDLDYYQEALAQGYLGLLSAERVRHELCLALEEANIWAIMQQAEDWGVLGQLLPNMRLSPQLATQLAALQAEGVREPLVVAGVILAEFEQAQLDWVSQHYHLPRPFAQLCKQLPAAKAAAFTLAATTAPSEVSRQLAPFDTAVLTVVDYVSTPSTQALVRRYRTEWSRVRPILNGEDLQQLGVPQGRLIGSMLAQLRAARLDQKVYSRADEEALVQRLLAESAQVERGKQ